MTTDGAVRPHVPTSPDPSRIMALATGYWDSAVLLAANRLGVFDAIASGSRSGKVIAAAIGAPERTAERLLDGCAALGLVTKSENEAGAEYENSPAADAFLVTDRPGCLSSALKWSGDQYAAWGRLADVVLSDRPSVDPALHLGAEPSETRNFVLGMHQRASGVARGVVNFVDLTGVEALLDVGGGPGTYSMLLARRYPGLRSTVLDLPGVVTIARELVSEAGLAEQVAVEPGDGITSDYGEARYDAVLFSGVLHQMSTQTCRTMLAKAHRALRPGGRVIVCDIMSNALHTEPPFAALFSLQMLLSSESGAVFAASEISEWMTECGFASPAITALPPPLPYTIVTAAGT